MERLDFHAALVLRVDLLNDRRDHLVSHVRNVGAALVRADGVDLGVS